MIGLSFARVMKAATRNLLRNFWLTLATLVIMTITLLIVLMLYYANVFGLEVIKNIQQKVDLSVTFKEGVSTEAINKVANEIRRRDDVTAVEVVSSDDALLIFKQHNADKPLIEDSLKELGSNPLPANLFIVAKEPRYYEKIAQFLTTDQFSESIDEVNYKDSEEVINKLIHLIDMIKNGGLIISAVFALLAILIMFNTVRLAIYSFREEIDIMHLVGASGWYIRGPFVFESVMVAIIAVVLASGIALPVLKAIAPQLKEFFFAGQAQGAPFDIYQYTLDNWLSILELQIGIAVGLAVFSSVIALQRYLKR